MVLNSHDQSYFEIFEAMEKIKPSYVIILIFFKLHFSQAFILGINSFPNLLSNYIN